MTSEALLFFSLGIFIRQLTNDPNLKIKPAFIFVLWLLVLIITTSLAFFNNKTFLLLLLYKLSILIGIISIWKIFDNHKVNQKFNFFSNYFEYTFFIFVFHEPLLTVIKKIFFVLVSKTQIGLLTVYFIAPIVTILICIMTGFIIKNYFFSIYKVITGNR